MRLDYISDFNGTAEAFRSRLDEMIAMKRVELARLEKVRNVVDGIASAEQMVADPTVNGDREPLPSVLLPKIEEGSASSGQIDDGQVFVNGRPLVAPRQAAA